MADPGTPNCTVIRPRHAVSLAPDSADSELALLLVVDLY